MSRRRKFFIIFGVVLIAVCGGGTWALAGWAKELVFEREAEAAYRGDRMLEVIADGWEPSQLRLFMSAEFFVEHKDEERIVWCSEMKTHLGDLKKIETSVAILQPGKDLEGKQAWFTDYKSTCQFQKMRAEVRMRLVKREIGDWQIASVDIDPLK